MQYDVIQCNNIQTVLPVVARRVLYDDVLLKCLLHVQMTMTYLLTVTKQMAVNQNEFLRTGNFFY